MARESVHDLGAGPGKAGSEPQNGPEPRFLAIGQIVAPKGVRGEVKVDIITGVPERFAALKTVFVGEDFQPYELVAQNVHPGGRQVVLRLGGVSTRNDAEALRGRVVYVPVEEAIPLEEGQYFHHQVIGLAVETEEGERLGSITEILVTGSNDVYVLQGPRGEILIPALDDVVLRIDLQAGLVVVRLPAGLLD